MKVIIQKKAIKMSKFSVKITEELAQKIEKINEVLKKNDAKIEWDLLISAQLEKIVSAANDDIKELENTKPEPVQVIQSSFENVSNMQFFPSQNSQ